MYTHSYVDRNVPVAPEVVCWVRYDNMYVYINIYISGLIYNKTPYAAFRIVVRHMFLDITKHELRVRHHLTLTCLMLLLSVYLIYIYIYIYNVYIYIYNHILYDNIVNIVSNN